MYGYGFAMEKAQTPRTLGHNPGAVVWFRTQKGWTQAELARRAKIAQGSLSQIEAGLRNTSDETRRRLAVALGCPVELLLAQPVRVPN